MGDKLGPLTSRRAHGPRSGHDNMHLKKHDRLGSMVASLFLTKPEIGEISMNRPRSAKLGISTAVIVAAGLVLATQPLAAQGRQRDGGESTGRPRFPPHQHQLLWPPRQPRQVHPAGVRTRAHRHLAARLEAEAADGPTAVRAGFERARRHRVEPARGRRMRGQDPRRRAERAPPQLDERVTAARSSEPLYQEHPRQAAGAAAET